MQNDSKCSWQSENTGIYPCFQKVQEMFVERTFLLKKISMFQFVIGNLFPYIVSTVFLHRQHLVQSLHCAAPFVWCC